MCIQRVRLIRLAEITIGPTIFNVDKNSMSPPTLMTFAGFVVSFVG
jgi:hypothetical protein